MDACINIENCKTQKVEKIRVPLLEYVSEGDVKFDISALSGYEFDILKNAVDQNLEYTNIEMFFTDADEYPNFGPDYQFKINGNILEGVYTRNF